MLATKSVSQFKKNGHFVIPGVIDAVLNRRLETSSEASRTTARAAFCVRAAATAAGAESAVGGLTADLQKLRMIGEDGIYC